MQLTQTDKQKIQDWLNEKCSQLRCFCCGENHWVTETSSIVIGYDIHNTRFYYSQGIPVIPIICKSCGYVIQFSSNIMGFKPNPPKVEETPTDTSNEKTDDKKENGPASDES